MNRISNSWSTRMSLSLSLCLGITFGAAAMVTAQPYSGSNMAGGSQTQQRGALGLVVNWNPQGLLTVTKVVPGGPAAKAGIKVGDRLLAIDGANIQGLPANQVFSRILGAVGTTTTMTLSSPNRGNYQAKLTRVTVEELKKNSSFDIGWQPAGAPATGNSGSTSGGYRSSSSSNNSYNSSSSSMTGTSAANWRTYGGAEQGFSVKYPPGWSVNQDSQTGKVAVKSPGGSQLSVLPFFIPSNNLNVSQSQSLFSVLLKRFAPGVTWSNPVMMGGALRAMSTDNNINSIAGLALSAGNNGTAGRLIVFQVPNNANAQSDLNNLSRILQTLTITGGTIPASAGSSTASGGADYSNNAGGAGGSNYVQLPYERHLFLFTTAVPGSNTFRPDFRLYSI